MGAIRSSQGLRAVPRSSVSCADSRTGRGNVKAANLDFGLRRKETRPVEARDATAARRQDEHRFTAWCNPACADGRGAPSALLPARLGGRRRRLVPGAAQGPVPDQPGPRRRSPPVQSRGHRLGRRRPRRPDERRGHLHGRLGGRVHGRHHRRLPGGRPDPSGPPAPGSRPRPGLHRPGERRDLQPAGNDLRPGGLLDRRVQGHAPGRPAADRDVSRPAARGLRRRVSGGEASSDRYATPMAR